MTSNSELINILNNAGNVTAGNSAVNHNSNQSYNIKSFVKSFNDSVLENSLIPQLKRNEKQKRFLKTVVLKNVCIFIVIHSLLMFICLGVLMYTITLGSNKYTNINFDLCSQLIGFMKYFITASLGEFITMLAVIVHYVFDKSIVDLIALFKTDKRNKKNSSKKKNKSTKNKKNNTKKSNQIDTKTSA